MSEEFTEPVVDPGKMYSTLVDGFRSAAKNCLAVSGLPSEPVPRRKPYEGQRIDPLGITGKFGMDLHLKSIVTMRLSKARGKCPDTTDFDLAIEQLIKAASLHCSEYFASPGRTLGACNYPDEKSGIFVGILWNGQIIKMIFRAETFLEYREKDPYPRDPMDPYSGSI
ncbi:MAG: hypothetical protein K2Z81_15280 [Cyanobacteria bacterium]|nr:hypothetical protein [Cyanobacteriota bacterium]